MSKPAPLSKQAGSSVALRAFRIADYETVIAFWQAVGLKPSRSDTKAGMIRKLERDPELFLLALSEREIVGTVMGSYDGRRGWMGRLAVAPSQRGLGLARLLVDELERRLRAIGSDKVNLLIEPDNEGVQGLYERLGYSKVPLIFMEKWLA